MNTNSAVCKSENPKPNKIPSEESITDKPESLIAHLGRRFRDYLDVPVLSPVLAVPKVFMLLPYP